MNNAFRSTASSLLRFFPHALIALLLVYFGYHSVHYYSWSMDDLAFYSELTDTTIFDTSISFYENSNGRLASHFFLSSVIKLFSGYENFLFVYRFILLFAFVISLGHLLKIYLQTFRKKIISQISAFFYAAFITAFFFFFFYAGNFEVWFWVSSTGVYLVSLILAMNGFALLFSEKQTLGKTLLATFLFFLAGGFSESFAIMYLILLFYFIFNIIKNQTFFLSRRTIIISALTAITITLLINIFSGGAQGRLEQLNDFRFLYAIKNTLHSLALPFLRYQYLWISIVLTGCFLRYAHFHFPTIFSWKHFAKKTMLVLLFISLSFFIPCYLLSDIVPDRAASLGYLAGVLFLFDYFIFRSDSFARQL